MEYETKYQKFTKEELVILLDALKYDTEEADDDPTDLQKALLKELKTAISFQNKLDRKLGFNKYK